METTVYRCDVCHSTIAQGGGAFEVRPLSSSEYNHTIMTASGPMEHGPHHFCSNECLLDWLMDNWTNPDNISSARAIAGLELYLKELPDSSGMRADALDAIQKIARIAGFRAILRASSLEVV